MSMDPLNKEMASEHEMGLDFVFILHLMLFAVLTQVIDPLKSLLKGLDVLAQALHGLVVAVEHVLDLANRSKQTLNSNALLSVKCGFENYLNDWNTF